MGELKNQLQHFQFFFCFRNHQQNCSPAHKNSKGILFSYVSTLYQIGPQTWKIDSLWGQMKASKRKLLRYRRYEPPLLGPQGGREGKNTPINEKNDKSNAIIVSKEVWDSLGDQKHTLLKVIWSQYVLVWSIFICFSGQKCLRVNTYHISNIFELGPSFGHIFWALLSI